MSVINRVKVASGHKKAELVLKNCSIINVYNEKIEKGDIAIEGGIIAGIGEYSGEKEIDINGQYVCPGFIDGHVHIESSMVTPPRFASSVIPHGTTTVISDPHEIANVCGVKGIKYMLKSSKELPLDVYVMLPSCVPTTNFDNSGAIITADDLQPLLANERVLGLGEVMDYMGVITGEKTVHDKINITKTKMIDGHAPGVTGKQLNAYITAGIKTDHECTTLDEMEEKISKGMYILLREGSVTKNVKDLISGVNEANESRIVFCTDDKQLGDIKAFGHINYNIRLAISSGINPIKAIKFATINSATCYRLYDRGAIAPGLIADLVVLDNLVDINAMQVYKKGKLVAVDKKVQFEVKTIKDKNVLQTVSIKNIDTISFDLHIKRDRVNVIKLIDHNILTQKVIRKVNMVNHHYVNNRDDDILKLAVIERHQLTGNIGLGLVEGFGLKNGAIALTISHDSHNMVVIGNNDQDMKLAVKELNDVSGGITICQHNKVVETLQLEVAGLMTDSPISEVKVKINKMIAIAKKMGVNNDMDPFITLAFLSLPVIPELKLTDSGLFDTNLYQFIDIEEKVVIKE